MQKYTTVESSFVRASRNRPCARRGSGPGLRASGIGWESLPGLFLGRIVELDLVLNFGGVLRLLNGVSLWYVWCY
jgi:hypothetical protein